MQSGERFVMTHPLWRPFDPAATLRRRQYRIAQRQVAVTDDRDAYGELKVRLAGGAGLNTTDDYNGHKAGFIYDLYEKIFIADPTFRHDPRPRP
jgi:hypothetical protein